MNKFLKAASYRFNKKFDEEFKISPISDNPDEIDELINMQKIPKREFVIIKEDRIELNFIYGYRTKVKKDFVNYDNKYYIQLNPMPEEVKKIPLYGNYLIHMDSEIEMKKYALVLDALLKNNNCDILDIDEF